MFVNVPLLDNPGWERSREKERIFANQQPLSRAPFMRKPLQSYVAPPMKSFKQALLAEKCENFGKESNPADPCPKKKEVSQMLWSNEDLNLEGSIEKWMERSLVGRMKSLGSLQFAQDFLV